MIMASILFQIDIYLLSKVHDQFVLLMFTSHHTDRQCINKCGDPYRTSVHMCRLISKAIAKVCSIQTAPVLTNDTDLLVYVFY